MPWKRNCSSTTAIDRRRPIFAVPTGWKIVVPISPAAFASEVVVADAGAGQIFLRAILFEPLHQPPRGRMASAVTWRSSSVER
jgi:hypothetical protein